jgi:hypothetical protein
MPEEKLPVVTQICSRLWLNGPRIVAFTLYEYTAMIKTDPNQPNLSGDHIEELIKGIISRTWDVDDFTSKILSPDWTYVKGFLHTPVDSSNDDSTPEAKICDPSSDDRNSSEAEPYGMFRQVSNCNETDERNRRSH